MSFLLNSPVCLLLQRGWRHAGKYRAAMAVYLVLFVAAQLVALLEPYIIGRLLNALQGDLTKAPDSGAIWRDLSNSLWIFFLIQFFFWVFHGPGRVIERIVAYRVKANYKAFLFRTVTQLPLRWHRAHHSGESIDKINRAADSLSRFFDESFELCYMIFRLLGSLVVLFWFMPLAGWVALLTTAAAFVNVAIFDTYLSKQYTILNKMENMVASAVHDYVTNIASVITLRLEGRVLGEVWNRMMVIVPLFSKTVTIHEIKWFINSMLIALMTVAVLLYYGHEQLSAGHLLMGGTFFTLFEYLRRIGESFYNFTDVYGMVVQQAANVRSGDTITEAVEHSVGEKPAALPADWKTISISNLYFRYQDEEKREHHLEDITLNLVRGQSIAFVGESGSGKSTLLSLLRGLQPVDRVRVECDGTLLPEKLAHLSRHTTLIPQDPDVFSDTILFNITFGLDADAGSVEEAVFLARFDGVLPRLDKGLETNIAEKGVNLSGGEKQRLALARGIFFCRDSDILLLDEPTSSVDPINERLIYQSLLARFADKCVVSAIHKLHLLEMFDQVYVFNDGRLVEHGSFQDLVARAGTLAAMWRKYQPTEATPSAIAV